METLHQRVENTTYCSINQFHREPKCIEIVWDPFPEDCHILHWQTPIRIHLSFING